MKNILTILCLALVQSGFTQPDFMACNTGCTGNLGENIFPNGNFGAGISNILPVNPGIAPGYNYTTFPPPNDGAYTITNNTGPWGSFASNWINIFDNGPEPDGYMMVVNAAYTPGLFYDRKVAVCPNTLYEMSVDLISMLEPAKGPISIPSNVAFLIDNQVVCSTGDIPHDATWRTYRFSFTAAPGQDSVRLSFRNNAPGGIGNDLALDNISFKACGPLLGLPATVPFCPGGILQVTGNVSNSPYNTPVFQWQISENGIFWNNIPGENALTLSFEQPQNGQFFRLVAANTADNLTQANCRAVSAAVSGVEEDLSGFAISGADTIVCNGAPAVLEAGQFAAYQWSNGTTGAQIQTTEPGWYAVTVTSVNQCVGTDSLLVYEVALTIESAKVDPTCFGGSDGQILLFNRQGGVGPLRYTLQTGLSVDTPLIAGLAAGTYLLNVQDSIGCAVAQSVTLDNPPALSVEIGDDRAINACDTLVLTAITNEQDVQYSWWPADSFSCSVCPQVAIMPLRDIGIGVMVENEKGCTGYDSIWVRVIPRLEVYAPNVFWADPESEGNGNDFFSVFTGKSAVLIRRLQVFDRWGNLLFERRNTAPNDGDLRWYGLMPNGRPVEAGVYVWLAEIEFSDGVVRPFSGDVTVLR